MTSYQVWERVFPQEKRRLGLIIGFSLVAHVAFFFFFQIEQLPHDGVLERPPAVVFISNEITSSRLNGPNPMMWINWRDSSVIAMPDADVPEPDIKRNHEESLLVTQRLPDLPEWQPLEIQKRTVAEDLKTLVENKMRLSRPEAMPLRVEAPPKLSGSVVEFGQRLKDREVLKKVQLPRPQTKISLTATEYFLRVLPGGAVTEVKVNRSCGDPEIDQQGVRALTQWRFSPVAEASDIWARATVFWDFKEDSPDNVEILF